MVNFYPCMPDPYQCSFVSLGGHRCSQDVCSRQRDADDAQAGFWLCALSLAMSCFIVMRSQRDPKRSFVALT